MAKQSKATVAKVRNEKWKERKRKETSKQKKDRLKKHNTSSFTFGKIVIC
jgi:hypothetical protein